MPQWTGGSAYTSIVDSCADGCGCGSLAVGGGKDDTLITDISSYTSSPNAAAKEKIINGITRVMKSMGLAPKTNGSKREVLEQILKSIPNRKRNKKSFKADAEAHKKLCDALAKEINSSFPGAINTSSGPELVAQQVAEFVSSLFAGLQTEYVAVSNDVKQTLLNIEFIRNAVKQQMEELKRLIDASTDPEIQSNYANSRSAYDVLDQELERQLSLLRGFTNTEISEQELKAAKYLTEKSQLFGVIEGFSGMPGNALFSDYLSNILTATVVTAQFADVVDQALKATGMKLDEWVRYCSNKDMKGFMDNLSKRIIDSKDDPVQKDKLIKASELLFKNFYRCEDIAKKLKEEKKGSSEVFSESNLDNNTEVEMSYSGVYNGSYEDFEDYVGGDLMSIHEGLQSNTLDKRVKVKQTVRDIIFVAFTRKFATLLDGLCKSVDVMVSKVGSEIPISDQLDGLYNSLRILDENDVLSNQNSFYALIGYYNDARSREVKHQFLAQLEVIASYLDTMQQMSSYSKSSMYLRDLSNVVKQIKSHVDEYSEKVTEKYGSGERDTNASATNVNNIDAVEVAESAVASSEGITGGAAPSLLVDPNSMNIVRKSVYKMKRSLDKFTYYYKTAQIRFNLEKSGKEIDAYSENYTEILGSAIGKKIDEVRLEYYDKTPVPTPPRKILDKLNDDLNKEKTRTTTSKPEEDKKKENMAEFEALITLHKEQMECKIKMWQTLEALDQYLKHFTAGLVKNPEDVKDIVSMLEDINVIEHWYNKSTGTALHMLYDSFNTDHDTKTNQLQSANSFDKDHYYQVIKSAGTDKLGKVSDKLSAVEFNNYAKPQLAKVMDSFKMLKNLVSVFTYIGERFGGEELHRKTFMSPTQIYKNLLHHLMCSSYKIVDNKVSMRSVGDIMNNKDVDRYFVMMIKSMAAKVLTVVGLYDVLERPLEISYPNPVRMILGAADETPRVETKAVELYVRLPLLVELYRDLFGFTNGNSFGDGDDADDVSAKEQKIVMLPEMEGLFSGIIELIFRKNREINIEQYSDEDVKELVKEVNIIYAKMASKHGDNACKEAINELVQEVNRRYGLLKKDARNKYIDTYGERFGYRKERKEFGNDYEILPDETEYEVDKVAPSKKYETEAVRLAVEGSKNDLRFEINDNQRNLFYKFRCMLERVLLGDNDEGDLQSKNIFKPAIKSASRKLAVTASDSERFKIVAALLRNRNNLLTTGDRIKYILFHETVVSGLNVLSAIYTTLSRYRMRVAAVHMCQGKGENAAIEDVFGLDDSGGADKARSRVTSVPYWSQAKSLNTSDGAYLRELLRNVFGVSKDLQGLVEVRIDDKINLNWNGLKSVVEDLFNGVKYFMDLLRPSLEQEGSTEKLVAKYLAKDTPGSYYYLQERLMEQLMIGRATDVSTVRRYRSLNELTQILNEDWVKLTQSSGNLGNTLSNEISNTDIWAHKSLTGVMGAVKVFWLNPTSLEKLLVNQQGRLKRAFPGTAFRYKQLYDSEADQVLTNNRSLLFSFNQLVAKYLYTFLDHTSNKMYIGLIESFANGAFNAAINDVSKTYPDVEAPLKNTDDKVLDKSYIAMLEGTDLTKASPIALNKLWQLVDVDLTKVSNVMIQSGASDGMIGKVDKKLTPLEQTGEGASFNPTDPNPGQILFTSLAVMLYNMLSSKDEKGELVYLERDLSAVPSYMKEKLRANLVGFRNLFKELLARAEFYKSVVGSEKLEGKLTRSPKVNARDVLCGIALAPFSTDASKTQQMLTHVCTDVINGCTAILSCIEQVVREIADEPKHSEFSKGSIEEFKSMNKTNPFMPISNALYVLRNSDKQSEEAALMPFWTMGDTAFKLTYANRATVHRMDLAPSTKMSVGYTDLVSLYNTLSDSKFSIVGDKAEKFFSAFLKGVRYVHDVKNLKNAVVTPSRLPNRKLISDVAFNKDTTIQLDDLVMTSDLGSTNPGKSDGLRIAYELVKDLPSITQLTESSNVEARHKDIIKHISNAMTATNSPKDLRIQNVLDMNIIPININAMMRELPLTNIYNYSYTFDRMIIELFYGIGSGLAMDLIRNLCRDDRYAANDILPGNSDIFYGRQVLDRNYKQSGKVSIAVSTDTVAVDNKIFNALKSPTAVFISWLINPYKTDPDENELAALEGLLRGQDNAGLGRPKFLSDQVYGKLLFGSLYENNYGTDSAYNIGPQFSGRIPSGTLVTSVTRSFPPGYMKDGQWLRDSTLHYLKSVKTDFKSRTAPSPNPREDRFNSHQVVNSSVATDDVKNISKARLNTVLVRNIMFIVNVYRSLCLKIERDLHYAGPSGNRDPVVGMPAFLDQQHTELRGNSGME